MNLASRRLYFALWPDDATRGRLREQCNAVVQTAGGRPVPPADWHITLAFLGAVAPQRVAAVVQAAASVPVPALDLMLERYGYWAAPQVFWLGPAGVPAALSGLALRLWAALEDLGFLRDRRPFVPHLTLARKVPREPAAPPVSIAWPVARMVLVESFSDRAGARYEVIQTFPAGSSTEP